MSIYAIPGASTPRSKAADLHYQVRTKVVNRMRSVFRRVGLDIVRWPPTDFDERALATIRRVLPRTMTSPERLYALVEAVRYVCAAGLEGDVVECGVWRGGSMMAAALTLLERRDLERQLYLYDTFEGMPAPGPEDVNFHGRPAEVQLRIADRSNPRSVWCHAMLEDVKEGMLATGYDAGRMHFIKGRVEDTLPARAPARIAILRLDTDWYESTRHELVHLYPRLVPGGVLIIDDYGHWLGSRKAADEYFAEHNIHALLNRVDYSGRLVVKPVRASS